MIKLDKKLKSFIYNYIHLNLLYTKREKIEQ